jgi:hypothetical protein
MPEAIGMGIRDKNPRVKRGMTMMAAGTLATIAWLRFACGVAYTTP